MFRFEEILPNNIKNDIYLYHYIRLKYVIY